MPTPMQVLAAHAEDVVDERLSEARQQVGPPAALDVPAALSELQIKDRVQIEQEAALRWGAFAIASYTLAVRAGGGVVQTLRFAEGEDYANEAREHAALTKNPKLLAYLEGEIEQARQSALGVISGPR